MNPCKNEIIGEIPMPKQTSEQFIKKRLAKKKKIYEEY